MKTLTSPHNPLLKSIARLLDKASERRQRGLLALEGLHLLDAWLNSARIVRTVLVNSDAMAHSEVQRLLARLEPDTECWMVPPALLSKLSHLTTPPELIAVVVQPTLNVESSVDSCLLLESIQDPGNLGTILRSAAAAGVMRVYMSRDCVDVYSPKVLRAGMGTHCGLELCVDTDLCAVLAVYPGLRVVTHLSGAHSLYEMDLRGPCAFVFGNEGAGVSDALLALAHNRVRIPMPGQAESLNVACAVTVCLFERVRQLGLF